MARAPHPQRRSTWTLHSSRRKSAKSLYCKHFKAYQPLNTWWAEQGLIVHSEFRDGNVPAGHEQLRMKAMRFHLTALPGRVVSHARRLIVRPSAGTVDMIRDARRHPFPATS